MRAAPVAYLALGLLVLAALVSLVSHFGGPAAPRPWSAGRAADVVVPDDGRGWVEGLDGLYGVARSAPVSLQGGLEVVGYAAGSEVPRSAASGTLMYDRSRTQPGVNLMLSGDRARAELRSLDDVLLHAWEAPIDAHTDLTPARGPDQVAWRRAALLDDGSLVAIHDGHALVRIGADSTVLWSSPVEAHHDLFVHGGQIVVLTRGRRLVPEVNPREAIVDDRVAIFDLDGRLLRDFSLWDAFARSEWGSLLGRLTTRVGDVMHSNTIERLDGRSSAIHPAFRAGNWLLCLRDLDLVVVLDPQLERLVWLSSGPDAAGPGQPWRGPHDPTVTLNGTLLVFDNLGREGDSRLVELEVAQGQIVSTWAPENSMDFSSLFCGALDCLANGNVLVTESCRGRAFELTPSGEIVWEYVSPRRAGEDRRFVAALLDVVRLPADAPGVLAALKVHAAARAPKD